MSTAWEQYRSSFAMPERDHFELAREGRLSELRQTTGLDLEARTNRGSTLLMLACYHGHVETARWLIAQGADVHTVDDSGNTVLMGAAFKGHTEIVELLLASGADHQQQNPRGQTALDFAHMFGRKHAAELLAGQKIPAFTHFKKSIHAWVQHLFTKGTPQ